MKSDARLRNQFEAALTGDSTCDSRSWLIMTPANSLAGVRLFGNLAPDPKVVRLLSNRLRARR
jgi:hypothetical protein